MLSAHNRKTIHNTFGEYLNGLVKYAPKHLAVDRLYSYLFFKPPLSGLELLCR